jgi:hypothetical protein
VAFTRWLNARLELPEGSIRLPTELGFANVDDQSAGQGDPAERRRDIHW